MWRRCAEFASPLLIVLTAAAGLNGCAVTRPAQIDTAVQSNASQVTANSDSAPPAVAVPAEAQQQFDDALALMQAGKVDQAAQQLQALGTKYQEFAGPLLNLGILHLKGKRYAEAEQSFKAALQRDPRSAAAYNYLGIVYRNLGRFKDAESSYQQALAIDEAYALAHLNLGVLCDLYLQQPERALMEFERYLQLAPTPEPQVAAWVKELQRRTTKNAGGTASGEPAPKSSEAKS